MFERLREVRAELDQVRNELQLERSRFFPSVARASFNTIMQSTPESCFEAELNGERFHLPRDSFRTMHHCMHGVLDGPMRILIETGHLDWMRARTVAGSVFVDVGAATGAMTLPMSRLHGGQVHVVAFEPAKNTARLLRRTLAINSVRNVELVEQAVYSESGNLRFAEYGFDDTGETPWLPEGSSIAHPASLAGSSFYQVECVSIDDFFRDRPDRAKIEMIKIDIEGFEVQVLDGARNLIRELRPQLAIDIHVNPFAPGSTESLVRQRLAAEGYGFQKAAHVLLCKPDGNGTDG